ncbi:nitrous oxide reductase family maturation protein NosD [Planomonospora sp. ID82291]|uniref:right-handed parallel beta-helix repeat-containing protein n=1 Tax=Planomonospora sp. ID82291 TaxID=2738136 RepID=UPI0018C3C42D|nr:right-handed parallel beta-helix repeat-containing protein [Planomonospora sp. ID82291]MBG0813156.1 right-handed parallel beta-helix repeat-containing protein [Planomonospora sp. ID82291]
MRTVRPGESIQRALDEAGPGAHVALAEGVFAENVWIRHSGVTLSGAGPGRTTLEPGAVTPSGVPRLHEAAETAADAADAEDAVSGITVYGDGPAEVRIEGLTVRGFSGAGVYAHSAAGVTVRRVEVVDNTVWGVYLRESTGCRIVDCRASGSRYAGAALSFCPRSDHLVADNECHANAFGVFVDNSSGVRALRNSCHGNAVGMLLLNQVYEGEPPGGVTDCLVAGNDLYGNGLAAGAGPDGLGAAGPPMSGVGLALIGVRRVSVVDNHVHDNHPSGESVMDAAFVMGSSKDWGGDDVLDTQVLWNRVHGNTPLDHRLGVDPDRQVFAANTADRGDPADARGWTR